MASPSASVAYLQSTVDPSSSSTSSSTSEPPTGATPPSAFVPSSGFFMASTSGSSTTGLIYTWTPLQVFVGTYLPVLAAVLYRMVWSAVNDRLCLIDPFRQMVGFNGARADSALFAFYHSRSSILAPVRALLKGRWALVCSGVACLLACLLPALASEAIWIDTDWNCEYRQEGSNNPCPARMTLSLVVIRVLEVLLALTAVLAIALLGCLSATRTGLTADPSSIASVASFMRDPLLISDISTLRAGYAKDRKVPKTLRRKRYILSDCGSEFGSTSYSVRPADHPANEATDRDMFSTNEALSSCASGPGYLSGKDASVPRWRLADFVLTLTVVGAFAVILAYYLDWKDDPFNRFFNSNKFGPRFILTGAGTVISSMWKDVEHSTIVMAPFIRLAQRPSSFTSTIAFGPTITPFASTWITLRNRYWLAASVTIMALIGEALNIVISGVPYATGTTWTQFLVSSYMSLGVLGLMILTSCLVIFHRIREPHIPVRPETLGAKMSYLAGSLMLDDFEGKELESEKSRNASLSALRKKYSFRPTISQDGYRCWMVDIHDHSVYRE